MTYGEKIAQLRKNAAMTQSGLGDKLGVTAQAVSKWEHDVSEPDLGTLKKIADLFGISIDTFLDTEQIVAATVPVNPKEVAAEMAPVVTDSVVTQVQKEMDTTVAAVKSAVTNSDVLGHCTNCGIVVRADNSGCTSPRVLCKNCYHKQQAEQRAKEEKAKQQLQNKRDELRHKRNRCLFWGIAAALVALGAAISILVCVPMDTGIKVGIAIAGVWAAYALFGTIIEVFLSDSTVADIMDWCLTRSIRWPGIIFTLDFGGIAFLIAVKILFAILGFLAGAFFFAIGLLLSMIVSTFTTPFTLHKVNKKIKGEIPLESEGKRKDRAED